MYQKCSVFNDSQEKENSLYIMHRNRVSTNNSSNQVLFKYLFFDLVGKVEIFRYGLQRLVSKSMCTKK